MAFAKDSGATDITRDNYDFRLVREDEMEGQRCYVLELLPKRKSKDLLSGTIWVDANTYLPQRVEGEPAKNPSWWLKDVRIVLLYGYVGPMWLQTSSEATANVRVLGRSTVVWQDVRYQIGELLLAPHWYRRWFQWVDDHRDAAVIWYPRALIPGADAFGCEQELEIRRSSLQGSITIIQA